MMVCVSIARPSAPSPVPRMMATSGTRSKRSRTTCAASAACARPAQVRRSGEVDRRTDTASFLDERLQPGGGLHVRATLPVGIVAGLRRRGWRRGQSARRALRRGELRQLALRDLAQLADERAAGLLETGDVRFEL